MKPTPLKVTSDIKAPDYSPALLRSRVLTVRPAHAGEEYQNRNYRQAETPLGDLNRRDCVVSQRHFSPPLN